MTFNISNEDEVAVTTSAYHYISIPLQLYTDLCGYVDHYSTEVSGCGIVERIEHRFPSMTPNTADKVQIEFRIKEVYLPEKQSNGGTSTDISGEVISELLTKLISQGKDIQHLRLHWHSHANMDTFHSATDEDNYRTLSSGEFLVSLVLNKAHKVLGRVDFFSPVRVSMSGIDVLLDVGVSADISLEAKENIEKLDKYIDSSRMGEMVGMPDLWRSGYDGYEDTWDRQVTMGGVGNAPAVVGDDVEIEQLVARDLGISNKKLKKFKRCVGHDCCICKDVIECEEFKFHIGDKYGC